jgi:hypothetical protein
VLVPLLPDEPELSPLVLPDEEPDEPELDSPVEPVLVPLLPDEPELSPLLPDDPDVPDVPEVPEVPDDPDVPDVPDVPEEPEEPEEPPPGLSVPSAQATFMVTVIAAALDVSTLTQPSQPPPSL